MTTYLDPNDRTTARLCAAPGCGEEFVPSSRGPVRTYCSDRCKKRLQREGTREWSAFHVAAFYGTGSPDVAPSPVSLALLSEEYGLDWGDYFEEFSGDLEEIEERRADEGLRPLIEERPLGLTPEGHKRRTDGEPVDDGLPPDVVQAAAPGARYGTGYGLRDLKNDHPEDVL